MDKEISIYGKSYRRVTKMATCKAHCAEKRVIAVYRNGAYFREVKARLLTRRGFHNCEKKDPLVILGKPAYFAMK